MIIRMTLKSNLYTQIIERYFEDGGPFVLAYHNNKKEFEEFMKNTEKLKNYKVYADEKDKLRKNMELIIRQNFINYINSSIENTNWKTERFTPKNLNDKKNRIIENLEIKLVDLIMDSQKNNEVVFYIEFIRRYITV